MSLRFQKHQLYLACSVPLLAVYPFLGLAGQSVIYALAGFGAAVLSAFAGNRAVGWRRWLWWLFAFGLGMFFAADTLSTWYQLHGDLPFPSPADALYFIGYGGIAAGWILVGVRRRAVWQAQTFDSAMIAVAVAYCSWLFLIQPSATGVDLASLSAVSYPVMDTVLLSLLLWLVMGGVSMRGSTRWLLASFACYLVSDVVYAKVQIDSTYSAGVLDLGWLLSYVLWGAAALHPTTGTLVPERSNVRQGHALQVIAPAVAFMVVPASLLAQAAILDHVQAFDSAVGGTVLGILATARIVHLVRSEHAYRVKAEQSERHFRSLIENSTDIFTIMDAETRVTYVSPSVQKLIGSEAGEVVGTLGLEMVHPDDREETERRLALLLGGESTVVAEFRVRRQDGSWASVEAVATNRLDDPAVRGIILCSRDVGERDAAEAERQRLQQELHQAQKMDAIGRLAGGVAHDFNNLLMVIAASSESILLDLPESDQAIRMKLGQTQTAVERAAALTQQLLTFSRRQQPALRTIDLNEQVQGTSGMLRRIIGEEVRIELDLDPAAPQIDADPGQIDQVLFNLAVNARDAMPDGGTLSFSTRVHAGSVVLEIGDTGAGMDEATQARLFEPFFTTKAPGDGTGLGLATVYGIVAQIGGTVRVDSALGIGTTFTIVLPNVAEGPVLEMPEPSMQPAPGGETILLVEDEEIVRAVVREGLEQYGYRVFDTGDPREAAALARLHRADMLVTDIRMPHMSGFELFDEVRRFRPELKTIFMSGYSETSYAASEYQGTTTFLQKPFGIADMAGRVRSLLDGSEATASAA